MQSKIYDNMSIAFKKTTKKTVYITFSMYTKKALDAHAKCLHSIRLAQWKPKVPFWPPFQWCMSVISSVVHFAIQWSPVIFFRKHTLNVCVLACTISGGHKRDVTTA